MIAQNILFRSEMGNAIVLPVVPPLTQEVDNKKEIGTRHFIKNILVRIITHFLVRNHSTHLSLIEHCLTFRQFSYFNGRNT